MAKIIVETPSFDPAITVPEGTDSRANAAEVVEGIAQVLGNRTQYLNNGSAALVVRVDDLDVRVGRAAMLNWALRSSGGFTLDLLGIAYGLSGSARVWVAVGPDKILRSRDHGKTWASVSTASGYLYAVAYGNGMWVAVGGTTFSSTTPVIYSSPDGATWTSRTPGGTPGGLLRAITYAAGKFVAVGDHGEVQTSTNGTTWTRATPAANHSLNAIRHDGTNYVAVGNNAGAGVAHTSPNASTWTSRTYPGTAGGQTGVTVLNGTLVSVGGKSGATSTGVLCTSTDHGVSWTQVQELGLFVPLCCVSIAGLVVIGTDASTDSAFGGHPAILSGQPGDAFVAAPAPSNQETTSGSPGGTIWAIATDGQKCCVSGSSGTLGDSLLTA